jgi:hypothetical protein
VQRTKLNSTSLKSAAYCHEDALLELEFRSGAIYRFRDVPEVDYQKLLGAESKGAHFNRHIRNRFLHTKIG